MTRSRHFSIAEEFRMVIRAPSIRGVAVSCKWPPIKIVATVETKETQMNTKFFRLGFGLSVCLIVVMFSSVGYADDHTQDGVILINQENALVGNINPDDEPGFPVTIRTSGSYRLSSNLTVEHAPLGTDAIDIFVNDVTIDLNGFSITGQGPGFGHAIAHAGGAQLRGIVIRNGTIQGFLGGIDLFTTTQAIIENITVHDNAYGILTGDNSIVRSSNAFGNSGISNGAIFVGKNSLVIGNNASGNGGTGIFVADRTGIGNSTVSGNTASGNTFNGIDVDCPSGVVGNTAQNNGSRNISPLVNCTSANNSPAP